MIILCKGYSARQTPEYIELTITNSKADPADDRLSLKEISGLLKKSVKAVDKLSRRKNDPLPIHRGKGRPFGFRSEINQWLLCADYAWTGL
jgi:hypothetical protein